MIDLTTPSNVFSCAMCLLVTAALEGREVRMAGSVVLLLLSTVGMLAGSSTAQSTSASGEFSGVVNNFAALVTVVYKSTKFINTAALSDHWWLDTGCGA